MVAAGLGGQCSKPRCSGFRKRRYWRALTTNFYEWQERLTVAGTRAKKSSASGEVTLERTRIGPIKGRPINIFQLARASALGKNGSKVFKICMMPVRLRMREMVAMSWALGLNNRPASASPKSKWKAFIPYMRDPE